MLGEAPQKYLVLGGFDSGSNTNVVAHSGRILSLVEGGTLPFEMTKDLDTVGPTDFGGQLSGGFSAHPKFDPITQDLHGVGYVSGAKHVDYYVLNSSGEMTKRVQISTPTRPMMHDFALTERSVIVFDLPAVFSPLAALDGSTFPFIWNERKQSRLGVLPRDGVETDMVWFDIEPVWIYHTLNAFDDGEQIVLDVITHPRMFAPEGELRAGSGAIEGNGLPALDRYRLDRLTGTVTVQRLDDRPQEFPRINESRSGLKHRFGYTASGSDMQAGWSAGVTDFDDLLDEGFGNVLYKHDFSSGAVDRRDFGSGAYVGEAVFAPRDGSRAEDDGYLITYVHNPERGASDLLILSAEDFCGPELARVHLPARVPLGLHGSWIPDDELALVNEDLPS